MKKLISLLILVCTMSLVSSCTDETNNYTIVQEESYKAMQIEAVASLVENISRQPEMKDQLLESFSKVVGYKQFSDLAPFDSEEEAMVGTRRGEAIAACMTAMARKPEMSNELKDIAIKYLGSATDAAITSTILDYSKAKAAVGLMEAMARQPEMVSYFTDFSVVMLGE